MWFRQLTDMSWAFLALLLVLFFFLSCCIVIDFWQNGINTRMLVNEIYGYKKSGFTEKSTVPLPVFLYAYIGPLAVKGCTNFQQCTIYPEAGTFQAHTTNKEINLLTYTRRTAGESSSSTQTLMNDRSDGTWSAEMREGFGETDT